MKRWGGLLVVLGCGACAPATSVAVDAGVLGQDRRYQFIQRQNEGCEYVGLVPDASQLAAEEGPLTMLEDRAAWLAASDFEIELEHSYCYGSCPPFIVHIDQSGQVAIRATDYAPHPGVYANTIAPERARELFELMIDRGFLDLRRLYQTELAGCRTTHTDDYSSTFTLSAAGRSKIVEMYWGCQDSPANELLTDLDEQLQDASNVKALVEPSTAENTHLTFDFAPSYVLRGTASQGLLHIALGRCFEPSTWSVQTCDGQELAHGVIFGEARVLLLADQPFSWPDVGDERNVAVMEPLLHTADGYIEPSAGYTVFIRTLNEERIQSATPGDSCSP